MFPLDKTETLDTDQDGIGNNADADDDGDGVPMMSMYFRWIKETLDTDADGIGNNADTDDDGDGVLDKSLLRGTTLLHRPQLSFLQIVLAAARLN